MSNAALAGALATLKANTTDGKEYITAMKTMLTYCKNVIEKPTGVNSPFVSDE